jgi:hypothetical protein
VETGTQILIVQCIGLVVLSTRTQINGERTLVNPNEREATAQRKKTTQMAVPSRALASRPQALPDEKRSSVGVAEKRYIRGTSLFLIENSFENWLDDNGGWEACSVGGGCLEGFVGRGDG